MRRAREGRDKGTSNDTTMPQDLHGLTLTCASAEAADAFNRATLGYIKYRLDTPQHLAAALAADPQFALAQCLRGYFAMLSYKQANVAAAREAATAARAGAKRASRRETQHIDALDQWISGDLDGALATWEMILADNPTDVLALRLSHFNYFWLGRARTMRDSVVRIADHWGRELPGYATLLSCLCFAHEETSNYDDAEPAGRAAIEIDPGDLWGTHAVAHVMEMQGRHADGIAWLDRLEKHWEGGNNLKHHLWWHRAMFHLERRETDKVLELYDRGFRNFDSPLTKAQPDVYIDVQNAASMLFRLERQGVNVGNRWVEIADKAEERIGDCLSAFTLPHWMMALTATGRFGAADAMLREMREFGLGKSTAAPIVGRVAVPICEAVIAHRKGEHRAALDAMRPVLSEMYRLGGSHAQQDVLKQLFVDSAMRADSPGDARLILAHLRTRYPELPPEKRIGYAEAAKRYSNA